MNQRREQLKVGDNDMSTQNPKNQYYYLNDSEEEEEAVSASELEDTIIFRKKHDQPKKKLLVILLKGAIAEWLGTAIITIIGCGTISATPTDLLSIYFAFALSYGFLIQTFCHISGAHFNPAVSLAFALTRQVSVIRFFFYVIAQLLGSIAGSAFVYFVIPLAETNNLGASQLSVPALQGVFIEMFLTFVLVLVMFANFVDETKSRESKLLLPLAVGGTILGNMCFGYSLTMASMNPARSFGPALLSDTWEQHWVYWVGPIVGGALGAIFYRLLYISAPKEKQQQIRS